MKESEEGFNWGRIIGIGVILLLLFFTNPKQPERHSIIMEQRAEHMALVINAEANRMLSSYGSLVGAIGLVSVNIYTNKIKTDWMEECRDVQITNLGILSIGQTESFLTIGILGFVFDLTGLFISDQDVRDMVASSLDL